MSTLYISEFRNQVKDGINALASVAELSEEAISQKITFANTSVQSQLLNQYTRIVRIISDSDCYIACSFDPTASDNSVFIKANQPEYFGIEYVGTQLKLAVVGA